MTFWAGFEETAFVPGALVRVGFTGKVNFNAGEVGFEPLQDIRDVGCDGIGECVVH